MKRKPSFFERLTGSMPIDDFDDFEEVEEAPSKKERHIHPAHSKEAAHDFFEEAAPAEGELGVDVLQTADEIIIKTMVAGVRPEDLDISITRDIVTIRGSRENESTISEDNYFHKELYWGTFSRTIVLPAEVEVEEASAVEKHGLLEIHLPKIDKGRQTKLKVKSV